MRRRRPSVRNGFLHDVPHVRRIRGVVLVQMEDAGRVIDFREGLDAEVHRRTVRLTEEDRVALAHPQRGRR